MSKGVAQRQNSPTLRNVKVKVMVVHLLRAVVIGCHFTWIIPTECTPNHRENICVSRPAQSQAFLGCLPPQTKAVLRQEGGWLWSGGLTCGTRGGGGCGSREEEGSGEKGQRWLDAGEGLWVSDHASDI